MVGIHSADLAAVVTGLVRCLVIHVIGYAYLGEYARMDAHII